MRSEPEVDRRLPRAAALLPGLAAVAWVAPGLWRAEAGLFGGASRSGPQPRAER